MALQDLTKLFSLRRTQVGAPPGTLQALPRDHAPTTIRVMAFGPDVVTERSELGDVEALCAQHAVAWLDIVAPRPELLDELGETFGLHPLALEDTQNHHQRPKIEEFDTHDFLVMRLTHKEPEFATEQISIFLLDGVVITIQEQPEDCFEAVRKRIRKGRGRVRTRAADYLTYALVDALIDSLFPVLESYGEDLEALEEDLLSNPSREHLARLHVLRRELLGLRKATWPLRDTVGALHRDPSSRWSETTQLFLRDAHDHAIQAIDIVETYREMAASLVDLYLSSVSNRMNDVMKLLTIITTVFVPLGFIAGLYGMNFNPARRGNMPELDWDYGYVFALGLMAAIASTLMVFFWRRGWLRGS